MIFADLQIILHTVLLSLVAGAPLLMAAFCCTPLEKKVASFLPYAAVPAFLAALTVPVDMVVEVPWFFMGGRMGVEETGRIFLCLSAFIWFLASFSSRSMLENDQDKRRFLVFFLTAMAGNFGLILARDMLGYYLFFAVMSFAAYGLIVHKGTDEARKSGRLYLTFVMVGEVALFTALIILVHNTGSLSIENIAGISCHPLTITLLFIGFGIKIGAMPLHGWMMPAYQAAPIPAAAVLAGAMVNAGILGWLRFLPLGQVSCPQAAVLFIFAGAIAALYGVIIGMKRTKAGEVLGCSSISQMGLITVIFGMGLLDQDTGLQAAPVLILYVVHHSLAKSSLFFGYDYIERQGGTLSRLQMAAILLPALALAGLPFTSGAITKTAFKELALIIGEPWYDLSTFFIPITAMATTMLMLHFMYVLNHTARTSNSNNTQNAAVFTVSLIAVIICLFLWPAARNAVRHSLTAMSLLQALWPVTAGFFLFFIRCKIYPYEIALADDQKKQTRFDLLVCAVTRFLQEKERQSPHQSGFTLYLHNRIPQLRRAEKIMGRWKVAGLSYLVLCLCLLYLLL